MQQAMKEESNVTCGEARQLAQARKASLLDMPKGESGKPGKGKESTREYPAMLLTPYLTKFPFRT